MINKALKSKKISHQALKRIQIKNIEIKFQNGPKLQSKRRNFDESTFSSPFLFEISLSPSKTQQFKKFKSLQILNDHLSQKSSFQWEILCQAAWKSSTIIYEERTLSQSSKSINEEKTERRVLLIMRFVKYCQKKKSKDDRWVFWKDQKHHMSKLVKASFLKERFETLMRRWILRTMKNSHRCHHLDPNLFERFKSDPLDQPEI